MSPNNTILAETTTPFIEVDSVACDVFHEIFSPDSKHSTIADVEAEQGLAFMVSFAVLQAARAKIDANRQAARARRQTPKDVAIIVTVLDALPQMEGNPVDDYSGLIQTFNVPTYRHPETAAPALSPKENAFLLTFDGIAHAISERRKLAQNRPSPRSKFGNANPNCRHAS